MEVLVLGRQADEVGFSLKRQSKITHYVHVGRHSALCELQANGSNEQSCIGTMLGIFSSENFDCMDTKLCGRGRLWNLAGN